MDQIRTPRRARDHAKGVDALSGKKGDDLESCQYALTKEENLGVTLKEKKDAEGVDTAAAAVALMIPFSPRDAAGLASVLDQNQEEQRNKSFALRIKHRNS